MKTIYTLFLSVLLLSQVSCKKDKYQPIGDYGNSNIESFTGTLSSWNYSSPSYYGDFNVPALTQDVIDNGAVLVYVSTGTNTWSQLPLTFYTSASFSSTLEVVISPNNVRIIWTDSDLTQPATPPSMTFKVVVLSPEKMALHSDVDFSNYEEVAKTFNIE